MMSTLPNFEFYLFNLQRCKLFGVICELPVKQHRWHGGFDICICICLLQMPATPNKIDHPTKVQT